MHVDEVYNQMLQYILDNGELISNGRTKEGYYSVFGYQNRYNLREGFPAITGKKLGFRLVAGELLWFLNGETNVKSLHAQGNIRIWDEWATLEHTSKWGRPEGELGPVYGHQWRNFGATPRAGSIMEEVDAEVLSELGLKDAYFHKDGVDQIARVIERIKTNPSCRRLIVTGWNPKECDQVSLPPCHTMFQFKVSHGGTRLNCHLYQRSGDAFLGLPFNIASYALLTHMVAQVTGLEVGEFIHSFGDLHIYENHLEQVKEQLSRKPFPMAKLWLNPEVKTIDGFKPEDIKLIGYESHAAIKGEVAV